MAFSINRATLLGNVTRDPEMRQTQSGKSVLTINMATNHSIKQDNGSYTDIPTFHRIIVWGKMAEFLAKNVYKGSKIYVEGRISTNEYTDKSGVKQRSREIIADQVIPMSKNEGNHTSAPEKDTTLDDFPDREEAPKAPVTEVQEPSEPEAPSNVPDGSEDVDPDDIPF